MVTKNNTKHELKSRPLYLKTLYLTPTGATSPYFEGDKAPAEAAQTRSHEPQEDGVPGRG
ncbi:hypothetical protein E2C01_093178 [Portunus trituberculatus]|uniref:Uncharacterized protein n=1 Tax=Portunus trituberculatus TaxID=210409 RepID=A0A5B7JIC6_PORTR|nr:hypothetical protein [Portunus trituberculatus]